MPQIHLQIGVVIARQKPSGPWGTDTWRLAGVLPAAPPVPPMTPLGIIGDEHTFYCGPAELTVHSGETEYYRDNLMSGAPSVWVALRTVPDGCEVALATVDPYEAEGMTEGFGDMIEATPMPDEIEATLAAFVAEHHVERPFYKRKRDKVDPRKGGYGRPAGGAARRDEPEDDA